MSVAQKCYCGQPAKKSVEIFTLAYSGISGKQNPIEPGEVAQYYLATNCGTIFRYNGTSWILIETTKPFYYYSTNKQRFYYVQKCTVENYNPKNTQLLDCLSGKVYESKDCKAIWVNTCIFLIPTLVTSTSLSASFTGLDITDPNASSGSYTIDDPLGGNQSVPDFKFVNGTEYDITLFGAGGGGGQGGSNVEVSGGGGGSGAIVTFSFIFKTGDAVTIIIGKYGDGGNSLNGDGNNGGDTSVYLIGDKTNAQGGKGGIQGFNGGNGGKGGSPGGNDGEDGNNTSGIGGNGGAGGSGSVPGGNRDKKGKDAGGRVGSGGGGGGLSSNDENGGDGGNGGNGRIIIKW